MIMLVFGGAWRSGKCAESFYDSFGMITIFVTGNAQTYNLHAFLNSRKVKFRLQFQVIATRNTNSYVCVSFLKRCTQNNDADSSSKQ